MSIPAALPNEAIAAALASGMTLQDVAIRLAQGVCQAYAAYNNGSNLPPTLPGYHAFNQIWVYEFDPNVNPFSVPQAQARAASAVAAKGKGVSRAERQPIAYAPRADGAPPPCVGPTPVGTPSKGYQLFGFSATANDNSHNLLALRGTITPEEAGYDLLGWGDNTACMLPSQNWPWDQQDQSFAIAYGPLVRASVRVANLCDFVPATGVARAGDSDRSVRPRRDRGDVRVADLGRLGQSLAREHLPADGAELLEHHQVW